MRVAVKEGRTGSPDLRRGLQLAREGDRLRRDLPVQFRPVQRPLALPGRRPEVPHPPAARPALQRGRSSRSRSRTCSRRPLALGFSLFRTSSDYDSTYYNEVDLGATVYVRKHLFELIDAQLGVHLPDHRDQRRVRRPPRRSSRSRPGNNDESKVDLRLVRDTRDKIINTTTGNRMELDSTLAGGPLGGDDQLLQDRVPAAPSSSRALRDADPGVCALSRRGGRHPELRQHDRRSLLRRLLPGRPGRPARLPVPLRQPARHLRRADRRQDLRHVHRRVFARYRRARSASPSSTTPASSIRAASISASATTRTTSASACAFLSWARPLSLDYGIPIRGDYIYPNKTGNQFNFSFGTRF